jgi:N-acetylglucosaminyl-diphospho-decaprenol L-rhamnosyltransferase
MSLWANRSVLDDAQQSEGERSKTLAVVVVSYNVRELLKRCLEHALASLALAPDLTAQVWVVDNASEDASAAMVKREFPSVRLVAARENLGFARGNNLAMRWLDLPDGEDAPDFVMLLNPDAEPLGDAIGLMAHHLIENPALGGVGAQLQYADGSFQHGAFRFPGLLQLWFDLFPPRFGRLLDSHLNGRYPRSLYAAGQPFPVDFVLGASLMVRRESIRAVGLLDEGYFMYAEEVDWCWRMHRAGWDFACVPMALVTHHGGASSSQFRSRAFISLWRSRLRLYRTFYSPPRQRLAESIVRLGMKREVLRIARLRAAGELGPEEAYERTSSARTIDRIFSGYQEPQ